MKKKHVVHHHHSVSAKKSSPKQEQYLVIVRGWMLLVLFALMLGVGVIVGNFFNQQLNNTPQVAGVQTEAK